MRTVFCDGACEPHNPGGTGACAFVIFDSLAAPPIKSQAGIIPPAPDLTNNIAEYRALRGALRWLIEHPGNEPVEIRMDSQLVVNQMNGTWACNKQHLATLRDECQSLMLKVPSAKLLWVPREQNTKADDLTKQALLKAGIKAIDRSKRRGIRR